MVESPSANEPDDMTDEEELRILDELWWMGPSTPAPSRKGGIRPAEAEPS